VPTVVPSEEQQEQIRKLQDESAQLSRALVVATEEQQQQQQQIQQLQQQLHEQQQKHQQELQQQRATQQQQQQPSNNNQEELAGLKAQLATSERERSQAADKLADATEQLRRTTRELQHKIEYQSEEIRRLELQHEEAKAAEKKARDEVNRVREETSLQLNSRHQVATEAAEVKAQAEKQYAAQLEQLEAELRKALHSEEALKRDVDVEKRKYTQLLEEYERIKEGITKQATNTPLLVVDDLMA